MNAPIDRREWLKTSTLAAGASLVMPGAHGEQATKTGPSLEGRIFKAVKSHNFPTCSRTRMSAVTTSMSCSSAAVVSTSRFTSYFFIHIE